MVDRPEVLGTHRPAFIVRRGRCVAPISRRPPTAGHAAPTLAGPTAGRRETPRRLRRVASNTRPSHRRSGWRPSAPGSRGAPRALSLLPRTVLTTEINTPSTTPIPSPRRLSTTSWLWHPRPSIGTSDWMASMAGDSTTAAANTRAVVGDRPRSPIARPRGTNRMRFRLVSPRWTYSDRGASPTRPKSHRPAAGGRPLKPPSFGGIVAASTAPALVTRRNATQLFVRSRRATRPATASAITAAMANPGRNHGRTSASVVNGVPTTGR
jgi:hypothetical protein